MEKKRNHLFFNKIEEKSICEKRIEEDFTEFGLKKNPLFFATFSTSFPRPTKILGMMIDP